MIPAERSIKWIKVSRYCEITGDTPDAVYAKKRRRLWAEGVHFKKAPDGCLWINTEEVERWVEQSQPCPVA
jgi:hypothetical protein